MNEKDKIIEKLATNRKEYSDFTKLLPESDKKKIEALDQAIKILTDAGVMACIFSEMPSSGLQDVTVGYLHNIGPFSETKDGEFTKEFTKRYILFEYGMTSSYMSKVRCEICADLNIAESEIPATDVLNTLWQRAIDYSNYFNRGVTIPFIKKLDENI